MAIRQSDVFELSCFFSFYHIHVLFFSQKNKICWFSAWWFLGSPRRPRRPNGRSHELQQGGDPLVALDTDAWRSRCTCRHRWTVDLWRGGHTTPRRQPPDNRLVVFMPSIDKVWAEMNCGSHWLFNDSAQLLALAMMLISYSGHPFSCWRASRPAIEFKRSWLWCLAMSSWSRALMSGRSTQWSELTLWALRPTETKLQ